MSPVRFRSRLLFVACAALLAGTALSASSTIDEVAFGNLASERDHAVVVDRGEIISGGLDEPARRLLPPEDEGWEGGRVAFTMRVNPTEPNYLSVRFWGSDTSQSNLTLFIEGKQVGYRNAGDIDILDFATNSPGYNGRFIYKTSPLPLALTEGRKSVRLEIRASGPLFHYARQFSQFQKPMTAPSRGIYRAYTHTDGFLMPGADERQGESPVTAPLRPSPGPEVLDQLKLRVNNELDGLLGSAKAPNQMQTLFLARAYSVPWTSAHNNPATIERVLAGLDAIAAAYSRNPDIVKNERSTYNPDWFGLGPSGRTIVLLANELASHFDATIADGVGGQTTRREIYARMLLASRDHHLATRRQYTNQSMIKDLWSYNANRGLAVVAPDKAMPETDALRYLHESIGIQPWLGPDTPSGPAKPLGDNYWQTTSKGLTKELGYTGYYGEVQDWIGAIYDATRPGHGLAGDEKIRRQFVKIAAVRAPFRYPSLDDDGYRAMRHEIVVGWRDMTYPGEVTYLQRAASGHSPLGAAVATEDPTLVGYARQLIEDNQFFATVARQLGTSGFRTTESLLETPADYERLLSLPPSDSRLLMSWDQPDFVFTDEEIGVLAVKNGAEILYSSLYWRSEYGINGLARVHYLTPRTDRIGVVRVETDYEPSGDFFTRPNRVSHMTAPWIPNYPGIDSAHAGERIPIPRMPEGLKFRPGQSSPYAGKADFYRLRYGPYLVAMNTTTNKTFTLSVPADAPAGTRDLVARRPVRAGDQLAIGPSSTVVLFLDQPPPTAPDSRSHGPSSTRATGKPAAVQPDQPAEQTATLSWPANNKRRARSAEVPQPGPVQ